MCDFDKNRHIAQNQDMYLKAANEGRHPDSVWTAMIARRIICTLIVVAFLVLVVIGLFLE